MSNGSGLSTTEVLRPVSAAERAEGDPDRGRRAGLPAVTVDRTGALAHFSLIDTMISTCIHSVGHVAEPSHFFAHDFSRTKSKVRGPAARAGAADGGRYTADPRASAHDNDRHARRVAAVAARRNLLAHRSEESPRSAPSRCSVTRGRRASPLSSRGAREKGTYCQIHLIRPDASRIDVVSQLESSSAAVPTIEVECAEQPR